MSKSSRYKIIVLFSLGFILYGTNPGYNQHENKFAMTCSSDQDDNKATMCPLGYGKKSSSSFKRESFSVFDAGLISYSIYEEKLATVGILGNVFLRNIVQEV